METSLKETIEHLIITKREHPLEKLFVLFGKPSTILRKLPKDEFNRLITDALKSLSTTYTLVSGFRQMIEHFHQQLVQSTFSRAAVRLYERT